VLPLKQKHGTEKAILLQDLAHRSTALLKNLIDEHGIECDYEACGRLAVAGSDKEVRLLEKEAMACEEIGADMMWLDRAQARDRFGALDMTAALYSPDEAVLNPGKFVRGMKKVVESLGVEIYEHSTCTHVEQGSPMSLYTPSARIAADEIVLATNAYANPLGLFKRRVLPFYVYEIATEPLTDSQLDRFRWQGRFTVCSLKNLFWTLRLTVDNRLLFIECDGLYFYDIDRDYSHRPREYKSHHRLMTKLFPLIKDARITHQWGGRVGMTYDFLPSIGRTGKHDNIYYSVGYNGHGLAFSQLAGTMLAELMAAEKSDLTDHFLINKRLWGVPSAALTYLGINSYKTYFRMCDWMLDVGK